MSHLMCARILNKMDSCGVLLVPSVDFKLSKVELLRGIVCEKLTTAAREILAVVERTVSGYEEEAAALRRENDRQKKLLEAVLQPRVSLRRIEPAPGDGHTGGELPKDEKVLTIGQESASWAALKPNEEEEVEDKELENNHQVKCPPEAFTGDVTRKLTPLNLETVTPENVEERAGSRQRQMKPKGEVERGGISEDFGAHDSAHCAADSDVGDGVEDGMDGGDEEWKPDKDDTEIKSMKPKCNPSKGKKRKTKLPIVRRKRKNLEGSTENVPLSCKVCQALSGSKNMLIKHSWSHVDDPERLCGVCGEHSESPEELRSHLNSHKKTFSCDVCGKPFISLLGLQRHAMLHTGQKPYRCDVCDKSFVCFWYLKNHRWEHEREKPNKCDVCDQSFVTKLQARIHRRSHTGEKPYTCDVCGKSVGDLRGLSRHRLFHSGERRHSCPVCGKHFLTPRGLKVHEKIHSVRVRTFLCDVCCKTFYTPGELTAHLRTHGEEKVMCGVCGKGLSSNGALKRHLTVHTGEKAYECSDCGQTFKQSSHRSRHMEIHSGVKAFTCSVCGRTFLRKEYLKVHMRTHNGEKPYKCTVCDKGFTQSHCLKTHMKKHHVEEDDN